MHRFGSVLLVLLLGWVLLTPAMATDKVDLRQARFIIEKLQQSRALQALPHEAALRDVLGFGTDTNLQVLRQRTDRFGQVHTRYTVLYRGVPVWGEHVIFTEDAQSRAVRMHGRMVLGIEQDVADVTPAFDAEEALAMMKRRHLGDERNLPWVYENETSDLVIYTADNRARLAYAVSFFADLEEGGKPTRPVYIVDAATGKVLLHYEWLSHEDGEGPGGNAKTGRYEYGPGKQYPGFKVTVSGGKYVMQNENVVTVDLRHGYSGSTPYSFDGPVNTHEEINEAYCPLNDAHYFGGVVFGMYKDWYDTAPLTFKLTMRVHYGRNYENAFWNGSSMTFGDGATRFFPLVSLDVSCHEVSHGFTEQNSGLIYRGQSGGINEAFSDIAGEGSEYYMRGTNDWMVGAEIFKKPGALRYLDDPPKDGRSIGSAKDYKSGMDVHYSSGVFNKAFYVLGTTEGWNTRKAFDVFVKANRDYWQPSATFSSGAQGVVDAAKDYGYPTADVVAAFRAVDVEPGK